MGRSGSRIGAPVSAACLQALRQCSGPAHKWGRSGLSGELCESIRPLSQGTGNSGNEAGESTKAAANHWHRIALEDQQQQRRASRATIARCLAGWLGQGGDANKASFPFCTPPALYHNSLLPPSCKCAAAAALGLFSHSIERPARSRSC